MTLLSFSTYLPTGDLLRIIATTVLVAVIAPSAVALAVVGLERRETGAVPLGNTLVGLGAGVLALLAATGIYALVQR